MDWTSTQILEECWDFTHNPFFKLSSSQYNNSERLEIITLESNLLSSISKNDNSFVVGRKGSGKSMLLQFLNSFYLSKLLVDTVLRGERESTYIPLYINGTSINKSKTFQNALIWCILNEVEKLSVNLSNQLDASNWFDEIIMKPLRKYNILVGEYKNLKFDLDELEGMKDTILESNSHGGEINELINALDAAVFDIAEMKKDKDNITFSEVELLFNKHLGKHNRKLMLLIDEVSGYGSEYYRVDNEHSNFSFAINTLRNQNYINYKIAIESETDAEKITTDPSKYGRSIKLDYQVMTPKGVKECRKLFKNMLNSYIKYSKGVEDYQVENNFLILDDSLYENESDIDDDKSVDCLEQFVIYSEGVIREFLYICSAAMTLAAEKFKKKDIKILQVDSTDIKYIAKQCGADIVNALDEKERKNIYNIANKLKSCNCFKFQYEGDFNDIERLCLGYGNNPNIKPALKKVLTPHNSEYYYTMPMFVNEYLDIPTHFLRGSEKTSINKSILSGNIIEKICKITKLDIEQLASSLRERLKHCEKGDEKWQEYEDIILEILNYLFSPPLSRGKPQSKTWSNYERRDIIMDNFDSENGFWKVMRDSHDARFIVFDCKNHEDGINRDHIIKTKEYLGDTLGYFGVVVGRSIPKDTGRKGSKREHIEQQRAKAYHDKKVILLFDDNIILDLINKKANLGGIEEDLRKIYSEFIESIEPAVR